MKRLVSTLSRALIIIVNDYQKESGKGLSTQIFYAIAFTVTSGFISFVLSAATSDFRRPRSESRNKNYRDKFEGSILSISVTVTFLIPSSALNFNNSQPKAPAPTINILCSYILLRSVAPTL